MFTENVYKGYSQNMFVNNVLIYLMHITNEH